jgi:serine/threonine protein kinase
MQFSDLVFEKVLGKGGFGEASLFTNKKGKKIVVKSIRKSQNCQKVVNREVLAGQSLQHKNIVKFICHLHDTDADYLIFEYVKGKSSFAQTQCLFLGLNLYEYLMDRKCVPVGERQARAMFQQLTKAVSQAHQKKIAHLDIKLDNIMVDPDTHTVKLIDFGLCNFETEENGGKCHYRVGSQEYWAPEMVAVKIEPFCGYKADVWCLGVVLYCLLNGGFPYDPNMRTSIVRTTGVHPTFKFSKPISASAQDLIKKMLDINPDTRISLNEVMSHPWLKKTRFLFF